MPVTGLRGRQILDGDVFRNDLNITTSGSAVIRRIIAGTNITISSTGVDTGTGDVTINAATPTITLQNIPDAWVKDSVRVATTANITLSGTQTIDGIAVVAGDRVLVKDQSTASQNGIYVCAAGAWTRATDADVASEIAAAMVAVDSGTTNGGTTWDTDFKSTDTLGTTAMSWHRVIDTGYGAALTKTDDTNVTLTLGGSPSTALIQATSLTLGWSGQLSVGRGGTGASTLTGVLIGNGTSAFTGVAGTALQLLRRNSGNTAYEFFTGGNITKTDDTNVTLSLGGTPTGSTINSVSFTLGWSGQLSVGRGGTGASTLTGVLIGNGTSAVTAITGTASQLLRRNAGNTAYEFFTHDFASTAGATFTGQIISTRANNAGDGLGQIYLNGATGNRIDFNINGVAAPAFTTRSAGTKLVLYPQINATNVDYAIGIESGTLWFSVPLASGNNFKWYGGTTQLMALEGNVLKVGGFYWSAGVELIGSDGSANYIKSGTTLYFQAGATTLARLSNVANMIIGSDSTYQSRLTLYSSAAGQSIDGLSISTRNTTAAVTHTTRIYTDTVNTTGNGRSIIYAASPNTSNTAGQLDVLIESGGQFISRLGTNQSGTYAYSVYSAAGVENVRIDTGGTSWLLGGNVSIGNSTPQGKFYVYNTNTGLVSTRIDTVSSLTSLQTSIPFQISDYYNSGANGHQLYFNSTAAAGVWEYNITKNWGGILTFGSSSNGTSHKRDLYIYDSGQLRFTNYTSTTSFTGTAVGVLAFTSDGSIITIATPGGGSGLTGSGTANYVSKFTSGTSLGNSQIFDNGTNVGFGTTTFAYSPRVALASVGNNTLAIQTTDVVQGTTGTILYIGTDATTGNTNGVIRALGTGGTATAHLILNPAGGNVLIGTSTSSASSYILEMQASAPRVTLRATTNSSNTGYRFDTKDSAGVQRVGGIYMVPDTGSLSFIGLAADDSNYQFIARANGYCGIGQTNPQARMHITCAAGDNGLRIDASNSFEILFGGNNIANIYHQDSGQTIFFNTNAGPIYMGPSSGSTDFAILTTSINLYTTQFIKNANLPAGTGGTLYFADDYTSPIAARIFFGDGTGWSLPISKRNASVTTDLFTFKDSGQIQLNSYTTTSSFTGTAVGVLAFDASGNILTIATPGGGSSQWTTSGSNIYYTTGNVSIGTTSSSDLLHLGSASGTALYLRFNQLTRTAWQIGQAASNDELRIVNASTAAIGFAITANRSFQFPAYTAWNSFNTADAQGGLYFDTSGNIMSGVPPIYRIQFTAAGNFTLTNMASALQFFNNQSGYIVRADLTGYRRVRLHVLMGGTAGATNAVLRLRYRTTFSATATNWTDEIGTSAVSVAINTTNAYLTTSWIDLAAGAKGDVFIALMQQSGDGSADPVIGNVAAEFDF